MQRKTKKGRILFLVVLAIIILLNIAAWVSSSFCDWYIAHVFPAWVNTLGRIMGIFPFSVGEWMILLGLALVAVAAALGLIWAVIGVIKEIRAVGRHRFGTERREKPAGKFQRFTLGFYRFFAWALLCVGAVMTLNCFILYHASTFSEHYFGEDDGEYTATELLMMYNKVAAECNRLAEVMERDETGMVIYTGESGVQISYRDGEGWNTGLADMADEARGLMQQLGKTYSQLDGWYPRPKALHFSDFMCQQYMQGYYFPFSMEANYNDVMHILNIPSTMCHELAHLRGYIYEDEANLIGYLACVQSGNPFFQYAGNLSVLTYLYNDVYKLYKDYPKTYEAAVDAAGYVAVSGQVWEDNIFVSDDEWDRINGDALIDTEVVDKAADVFIDANLKVNGIADGKISYSRVVRLLLQYYRQ